MDKSLNKIKNTLTPKDNNLIEGGLTLMKFGLFFYILFSNKIDYEQLEFLDSYAAKVAILILIVCMSYKDQTLTVLLSVAFVLLLLHLNERKITSSPKQNTNEDKEDNQNNPTEDGLNGLSNNTLQTYEDTFEDSSNSEDKALTEDPTENQYPSQEENDTSSEFLEKTMTNLQETPSQKEPEDNQLNINTDNQLFTSESQLLDAQDNTYSYSSQKQAVKPLSDSQFSAQGSTHENVNAFTGFNKQFYYN